MPLQIKTDPRGVTVVWLDNPSKRNAMDDSMLLGLAQQLEQAQADTATKAVVIRGRNNCFCAGRDLAELPAVHSPAGEDMALRLAPINRLAHAFQQCTVPVIALVQGRAAGLGVSLACWADITIATQDALFSIPEARAGIAPSVTALSLMQAIGRKQALGLCLTGRSINALQAQAMGLVYYTTPVCEQEQFLEALLADVLQGAPRSLRATKTLLRSLDDLPFEAALAAANDTALQSFSSAELSEGLRARREKRAPAWQQNAAQAAHKAPSNSTLRSAP